MWQIYGEKETCGTKGGLVSGWKQSMKSVSIIDKQYDIMQLNVTLFKYTNEILGVQNLQVNAYSAKTARFFHYASCREYPKVCVNLQTDVR